MPDPIDTIDAAIRAALDHLKKTGGNPALLAQLNEALHALDDLET